MLQDTLSTIYLTKPDIFFYTSSSMALKSAFLLWLTIQIISMDFPAQIEVIPQEQVNRAPSREEQLTLMIRSKYELLKSKQPIKFNLIKNYAPVKMEAYNEAVNEFKALLTSMQEGETPDLTKYLPLIFGALEGSSSMQDQLKILAKRFGGNIQKIQTEQIIKGKIRNVNYGSDKRKQTNIREVSNKEAFESIGEYFDLKDIKNHRKMCNSIKSYLKSLKKFKQCMENSEINEIFNEQSEQNVAYIEFANQQISFNKLKIPNDILGIQIEPMIQEKNEEQNEKNVTPMKGEAVETLQKDETASGKKNEDSSQNKESKSQEEQKVNQVKENDQQNKQSRKRRTKQEILRDQQAKQRQKQQKALEQKRKEEERLIKQQEKQRQRLAKEKQKEMERQMKQKEKEAKQRERQAKQKEKQAERLAKEAQRLAKQAERKAKQAAKQAERLLKQKKSNPGQSLSKWFKPTEQSTPVKNQKEEKAQVNPVDAIADQTNDLVREINSKRIAINELRNMFKDQKMKEQNHAFEPYYTTVYIHKSRLEFDRFFINEQRFKQYVQPHDEYENGKYDDSSVEFQDFCGDFCDEKMDQMSVEDEEASFNSAIVPDTYKSEDEMSSLNDSKDQVEVRISQGSEWSFFGSNNYTADRYTMFCCFEEDALPLPLSEPEQSNNELTLNLKCELYKQIHGYYGAKDVLIKKLASIAERVPKSYLDTLIKQTTTKRGNQRLVKPQIIDFLTEQRENFANELEQIKKKRDEDNMVEMKGKMNEKEKEIERLILEQAGTYYIIDLLQFLREKGYRMLKRDLLQFIKQRTGSEWDDVRNRMNKMQLKQKERINNFLSRKDAKAKKEGKKENEQEKKSSKEGSSEDNNDKNNEQGGQMQPQN